MIAAKPIIQAVEQSPARNSLIWRATAALCLVATGSFVWFYATPLSADMPLHVAMAKAFGDLAANPHLAGYPYILNLHFSSYALPEIILAGLVKLFGVVIGTKAALTLYAVLFPLSVWFLVGQINPESRWTRLVGFPFTLNYLFHWGYWPALLGMIATIYAMAMTIKYFKRDRFLVTGIPMRILTFLMHPAPLVALGIFDTVVVLLDIQRGRKWWNPTRWRWKPMLFLWIPVATCWLVMSYSFTGTKFHSLSMIWGSAKEQVLQLVRGLYVTDNPWELALPLVIAVVLIGIAAYQAIRTGKHLGLITAAACISLAGLLVPVSRFFGDSSQIGCRISIIGVILLFSLLAIEEKRFARPIALWIIAAFAINLAVSHAVWRKLGGSYDKALLVLKDNFAAQRLNTQVIPTISGISAHIGASVGVWSWSLGYVGDAYNGVGRNDFGPVRYVGVDSTALNQGTGLILYHPYEPGTKFPQEGYRQVFMADDSAFTLYLK
jgi:hypothetical protein